MNINPRRLSPSILRKAFLRLNWPIVWPATLMVESMMIDGILSTGKKEHSQEDGKGQQKWLQFSSKNKWISWREATMIKIEFSSEEIEQLHHERRYHPHPRVRQRMEALYLKALDYPHQEIGQIMQISQKTLRGYLRRYQEGGIDALKRLNFYQPKSELVEHLEVLKEEFNARPPKTINEAVKRIEDLTGIRRSPTQVRKFLTADLGIKRLKVGQVPAKANPEAQQTFLEEELEPRLEEAQQGQRHVFFR
jgi:transposase